MIVTAWNNGSWHESGAGYGVKVNPGDKEKEVPFIRLQANTVFGRGCPLRKRKTLSVFDSLLLNPKRRMKGEGGSKCGSWSW
jgi:hypothetical protein